MAARPEHDSTLQAYWTDGPTRPSRSPQDWQALGRRRLASAHRDCPPAAATLGQRSDGVGLFADGRVYLIAGLPGVGKSLLAAYLAAEKIRSCERESSVLVVDFESNSPEFGAADFAERMTGLAYRRKPRRSGPRSTAAATSGQPWPWMASGSRRWSAVPR